MIDQLLVSTPDVAETILRENSHLIDAGLIQKLEQEAEIFKKRGYCNQADSLMNTATNLINLMQALAEQSACLTLIEQILFVVRHTGHNQQALYLLLRDNLDKLNNNFVISLKLWTNSISQKLDFNA